MAAARSEGSRRFKRSEFGVGIGSGTAWKAVARSQDFILLHRVVVMVLKDLKQGSNETKWHLLNISGFEGTEVEHSITRWAYFRVQVSEERHGPGDIS